MLFHFTGMLGVSEARAESVASILKHYSPKACSRLGTERIIEKTTLRCSGVAGDGSDDLLLLRAWTEYFGGLESQRFSFDYRDARKRMRNYPRGGGSSVIHHVLKRRQQEGREWQRSCPVLRQMPRIGRTQRGFIRGGAWLKHLDRAALA